MKTRTQKNDRDSIAPRQKKVRDAAAVLGKLGGSVTSPLKQSTSSANGRKAADKKIYYILSGEGTDGAWSTPLVLTPRGAHARQKRECVGGRWARLFELIPATDTHESCIYDREHCDFRDVPKIENDTGEVEETFWVRILNGR
jgi:hypothetical protein